MKMASLLCNMEPPYTGLVFYTQFIVCTKLCTDWFTTVEIATEKPQFTAK